MLTDTSEATAQILSALSAICSLIGSPNPPRQKTGVDTEHDLDRNSSFAENDTINMDTYQFVDHCVRSEDTNIQNAQ